MTGIYRRLLDRIERRPVEVLERRVALPSWEKAWVAARSLAGGMAASRLRMPAPRVARSGGP
jgi:phytoene synthase